MTRPVPINHRRGELGDASQRRGVGVPLLLKGIREPFALRSVDVLERRLDRPTPRPSTGRDFALHVVRSPHDPWLRKALPEHRWKRAEVNLLRGDVAYVAADGAQVASRVWVSRTSHRDRRTGLRMGLAPDEAYSYDVQAAPAYRALGAGAFVMSQLLQDLTDVPDVDRVYGLVDQHNRASQMLLRMVFGFTMLQTVKYLRVLAWGWQVPFTDEPAFGPCSSRGRYSEPALAL